MIAMLPFAMFLPFVIAALLCAVSFIGSTVDGARSLLPSSWAPLMYHAEQQRLIRSTARFRVVPAGRRSGKTLIAKRFLVRKACRFNGGPDGLFIFAAPTYAQAKSIYWKDTKRLVPKSFIARDSFGKLAISESELTITLINGAQIRVVGMDKPDRIEGTIIDGIIMDEFASMKADVWKENVRPALSTPGRLGWAWLIGVPEGRNHYYKIYSDANRGLLGPEWETFTWHSADILPAKEIEQARRELDELTFKQEYEAAFVTFAGRAYYTFDTDQHAAGHIFYDENRPLVLAFDFNHTPGICSIIQELPAPLWLTDAPEGGIVTACVDEVYIERGSNTYRVCDELVKRYRHHPGEVHLYGDPAGGAKGSAAVDGTDWELVDAKLEPVFGDRLKSFVPKGHPRVRQRITSTNSRFQSADGSVRACVSAANCPHTITSMEGTALNKAGDDIDKPSGDMITHLSDAIGYYLHEAHPAGGDKRKLTVTYT